MAIQRLNAKNTRRIAATTGLDVIRAWRSSNDLHLFITRDHQHGWITPAGEWALDPDAMHMDTCWSLDPNEPTGYRDGA